LGGAYYDLKEKKFKQFKFLIVEIFNTRGSVMYLMGLIARDCLAVTCHAHSENHG